MATTWTRKFLSLTVRYNEAGTVEQIESQYQNIAIDDGGLTATGEDAVAALYADLGAGSQGVIDDFVADVEGKVNTGSPLPT